MVKIDMRVHGHPDTPNPMERLLNGFTTANRITLSQHSAIFLFLKREWILSNIITK